MLLICFNLVQLIYQQTQDLLWYLTCLIFAEISIAKSSYIKHQIKDFGVFRVGICVLQRINVNIFTRKLKELHGQGTNIPNASKYMVSSL